MTVTSIATQDFLIQRGNNFTQALQFLSDDDSYVDLTGQEIVFRGVVAATGLELFRYSSTESPTAISVTSAVNGEFTIDVWFDETRDWPIGRSVRYEIELRDAADRETTWLRGWLIVSHDDVNDDA